MKEKGVTQQALADGMGVSLSAVRQMVGAESITTSTLEKIAKVLNVPLWQFFVDEKEIIPQQGDTYITCPHCGRKITIRIE